MGTESYDDRQSNTIKIITFNHNFFFSLDDQTDDTLALRIHTLAHLRNNK